MGAHFAVRYAKEQNRPVAYFEGELDVAAAAEVASVADVVEMLQAPLTIDLRGLTFVDLRGLESLGALERQVADLGHVVCYRNRSDRVERLWGLISE